MKHSSSNDYEAFEHAFHQMMWAGQKQLGGLLAEHALTFPQFLVLAAIQRDAAGCPIGELAKGMFQSFATMTGIINRLETARLVARGNDPRDGRKVVVTLTKAGQQLLDRAKTARREQMIGALAVFSAQDRREFLRLLTIYLETFEKENV